MSREKEPNSPTVIDRLERFFNKKYTETVISIIAVISAIGLAISVTLLLAFIYAPSFTLPDSDLSVLPTIALIPALFFVIFLLYKNLIGYAFGGEE